MPVTETDGKHTPAEAALRAYAAASRDVRCPICGGIEGCDHTVRERLLSDLGARAALSKSA